MANRKQRTGHVKGVRSVPVSVRGRGKGRGNIRF
uniref:Uncharacterized protein n=1 Tax=Nelumbo nucifera TaxID=4432 RepID=A0A822ZW00_NELNU|nr:TPA_asm: hypothetical protein HUJ06_017442 [Nelumbo nucifera]